MLIRTINIKEDIRVIIVLIAYGIFLAMSIDVLKFLLHSSKRSTHKEKKTWHIIKNIIMQIVYGIFLIYVSYKVSYKMANGYVPIYFIVFVISGIILYYFVERNYFVKTMGMLKKVFLKIYPCFLHIISFLCYPKDTIEILFKPFKILGGSIKNFQKSLPKKGKKNKKKTKKQKKENENYQNTLQNN